MTPSERNVSYGIRIEWDQIPSGTILRKFVAVDEGRESGVRVVIHGFYDGNGELTITDELVTADPVIVGKAEGETTEERV